MRLGLFLPASSWNQLKHHKLPFIKANVLEDPFLNAPYERHLKSVQAMSEEAYHSLLAEQYEALPDNLRGLIDFEYFCQQAQSKREVIESNHQASKQWSAINRKRYSGLGVLRLFEAEAISILHWSLVGLGHKAMLWVVDFNDAILERWLYDQPHKWAKVKYTKARPEKDNALDFQHLFHQPASLSMLKEWRLVLPWSLVREGVSLPFNALQEVHFGALFDTVLRQEIHRYSHFDNHLRSLNYQQVIVQRERFELGLQPLIELESTVIDKA
jgi:hypothetical protein